MKQNKRKLPSHFMQQSTQDF